MAISTVERQSAIDTDMRDFMLQWIRVSNDAVSKIVKIGQPVLEAYLKSVSGAMTNFDEAYRKSCEIPETECPPHCSCQLDWDACQGETVTGTIDIQNTGKQASQFVLSAANFHGSNENTALKPEINPSSFSLAPGDVKTVTVTVKTADSVAPDESYKTEIKIAGRYEQFVCLSLYVRKKSKPYCEVEHGEIPTRIVAHHWYDHFQCEELCFEPVQHRTGNNKPEIKRKKKKAVVKRKVSRKKAGG